MNHTKKKNQEQHLSLRCPEKELATLIAQAKTDFNGIFASLKRVLVDYLLSSSREMLAGPKYNPHDGWENWGSQGGSVYVAGERLKVRKPRLRRQHKEVSLPIYDELNNRSKFSQEVLLKALRGISCRNYQGTIDGLLDDFGLSRSSISRHLKEATMEQLKELQERSL